MRRSNSVLTPLSPHSSSFVQTSATSSTTSPGHSSSVILSPPPAIASGNWSLPSFNQFMTLPRHFLTSHFRSSGRNFYIPDNPIANGSNRSRTSPDAPLVSNGSTLDHLLNDDNDDWNTPSDHFILPHLMHFHPRHETSDTEDFGTHEQEEIDLTVSSSEDDETLDERTNIINDNDDVIEIIEPLQTVANDLHPMPLRRKRRRLGNTASEKTLLGPKRQCSMEKVRSVESTDVGMRNNELLQKFKSELKCTICLDVLDDITSTICGHIFCAGCIRQAIRANGKCPLCQRRLHLKDIHPLFF